MSCGERLAPLIVHASQVISTQLVAGNKLLCCGNGLSDSLSNIFSQSLLLQYKMERPGLPAICLGSNSATLTAISHFHSVSEIFSKQIKTLAQAGDILVAFSLGANPSNLVRAIHTAHDRGMLVIAFTGDGDSDLAALLNSNDIELKVNHEDRYRISEVHLLSIFCLCELIDQQLFGGSG